MRRTGSLFLFFALFAVSARAHDLPAGDLPALGRIWGVVQYAHPWMGYRDVELDDAALRAIARLRGGSKIGVAVDEMLRVLGDEATFVAPMCFEAALPPAERRTRTLADGVVYLTAEATDATSALRTAKVAVVDLRPQPGRCTAPLLSYELTPLLVRGSVAYPIHRKVRHYGYRSQQADSQPFDSAFATVDVGSIQGEATTLTKVVFIVDERSVIPAVGTALAAANQAAFVSVGRFPLHTTVDHCQIALGDNSIVSLRTSELVDEDGYSAEPLPAITLTANASESAVAAAALQLAKPRGARRRASGMSSSPLADYTWQADAPFATADLPSPEQRILAAFRIWNVVEFFHGARERNGGWHTSFGEFIAMVERATTRRDYELAMAEVMNRVPDAQALVSAPSVLALRGSAAPPFELMPVEEKPVVIASAAEQVKTGDELLRIDGQDVAGRRSELARYTSPLDAVRDLPKGAAGSSSAFTFRRPDGSQYEVTLARNANAVVNPSKAWRMLDGNIAYVDVGALADVETLVTDVASTRAMILDLRGDRVSAEVAAKLSTTTGVASMTRVPVLLGGAYQFADATQVRSTASKYGGQLIALVDERTPVSAARALAQTRFVGTASTSAQGAVSQFVVPGNIVIRFTASDVRNAEGEPGLEPDYEVERTIRGLADGRDEVLEAALAILNN